MSIYSANIYQTPIRCQPLVFDSDFKINIEKTRAKNIQSNTEK